MKSILSEGIAFRTAKRTIGLAGVIALTLACAGPTRAQTKPAQTGDAANSSAAGPGTPGNAQSRSAGSSIATATSPVQGATGETEQTPVQNPHAKKSAPKGQHEGIAVHGHWTIEVRNSDGKLVTHREFENALVTGIINDGGAFLAGILGRAVTPGSWQVFLGLAPINGLAGSNVIFINELGSPLAATCTSTAQITCSTNLTLAGPLVDNDALLGETLTFSGAAIVPSDLSLSISPPAITLVATKSNPCANGTSVTPASCSTSAPVAGPFGFSFTSRPLDGNTPAGAQAGDPNPVPVTSGQTVQVTVVISFH